MALRAVRSTVHTGQIVAVQAALAALLAGWSAGPAWLALVAPAALLGLALSLVKIRSTWLHEWATLALAFAVRRRTLPPGAHPAALLTHTEAATIEVDGVPAGVLTDAGGPTAILALGPVDSILNGSAPRIPPLPTLLPDPDPDTSGPPIRLRLVAATVTTAGPVPAYRRVVLAVQARRDAGHDEPTLRRALAGTLRRVRRNLHRAGLPATPVPSDAVAPLLAELAHHDPAAPAAESWPGLAIGGWHQATFRVDGGDLASLDALRGCAVTVSVAVQDGRAETHLRLAAPDPGAVDMLHRQLAATGIRAQRLDGAHRAGLAATLPFGGPDPLPRSGPPPDLAMTAGGAGLVLGTNRRGEPVPVRAFRPEPTRLVLVGGAERARLLALRALAAGAHVHVTTGRPEDWERLRRGAPALRVDGPGRNEPGLDPPAPLRPQLVVVDAPPLVPPPELPWRATLVVRDQITTADLDLLARADLVLLGQVSEPEAVLAGSALGIGTAADWFARIRGDMIGAVVPRHTVRWAVAAPTPVERQLLG
jgi:type VII secretion protein EccE